MTVRALVTGSAGHLGEALVRRLRGDGVEALGIDLLPSAFTDVVGSITDGELMARCLDGVDTLFHAATLHKPHVATHRRQAFVDTNVSGTLTLLEAAVSRGVSRVVFTSTTSVYGDAMRPPPGRPAVWVTEDTVPRPRNIYGVTKLAAENLCELFQRLYGLGCIVLRTSRFFPEADDDAERRSAFGDANIKVNEFLHRRVALEDVVDAHALAADRAAAIGFGRYIVSASTPFLPADLPALNAGSADAVEDVLRRRLPAACLADYFDLGFRSFERVERVYVNAAARRDLGWQPRHDFVSAVSACREGRSPLGALAGAIGSKGYHDRSFGEAPYPVSE